MGIRAALDALTTIQESLSITDPATMSVGRAYKFAPKANVIITDAPTWINETTMNPLGRFVDLRVQNYTIHSQLFVSESDIDRGLDIAASFLEAFVTAMDADISITQTVTRHVLRGGNPTITMLSRAEKVFPGLDLFIDVELTEAAAFS